MRRQRSSWAPCYGKPIAIATRHPYSWVPSYAYPHGTRHWQGNLSICDYPGFETLPPPDFEVYSKVPRTHARACMHARVRACTARLLDSGDQRRAVPSVHRRSLKAWRQLVHTHARTHMQRTASHGTARHGTARMNACSLARTCARPHAYVCKRSHARMLERTCTHACMSICMRAHIHTSTHTHIHTYVRADTRTHTHTCLHTTARNIGGVGMHVEF